MAKSHQTQIIEYILNDKISVQYGTAAWQAEVNAITTIAETVGTTFGPYGQAKLVIDNGGNVEVTSETVSILRRLHLQNPVTRMIRDVANSQLFTAGDETTATVMLMGALVDHADRLIEYGLHPTTVIQGYEQATLLALEALPSLANTYDITHREICEAVARTTILGSNTSFPDDHLATLVVDAVASVTDGYNVNLNAVRVRGDTGPGVDQSEALSGAVVDVVPEQPVVDHISDANILIVDKSVTLAPMRQKNSVTIESEKELNDLQQTEEGIVSEITSHLSELEVDILITDSISEKLCERLRNRNIIVLTSIGDTDRQFLSRTLRVDSVPTVMTATAADLAVGTARFHRDETYSVVTTENPGTTTLHVRSVSEKQLEEIVSIMDKAIEAVTQAATDGRVLPGGGAPEVEMALAVRDKAPSIEGKAQIAALAFADAVEKLPRTLAHNAGLDGTECLLALQRAHHNGDQTAGIHLTDGAIVDMQELGILGPMATKMDMLSNVRQVVRMILRVDGIIQEPLKTE